MPNFKNGKEYIITENNLFDLTKESYLNKKTINEIGYKLRKTYNGGKNEKWICQYYRKT